MAIPLQNGVCAWQHSQRNLGVSVVAMSVCQFGDPVRHARTLWTANCADEHKHGLDTRPGDPLPSGTSTLRNNTMVALSYFLIWGLPQRGAKH